MAEHNITGKKGEEQAVRFLQAHGYSILHRNWRFRHYELDIVAYDPDEKVVAVIEVKTRKTDEYGNPEEAVTETKIRRIVSAADAYIKKYKVDDRVRFDVISIVELCDEAQINHIKEAFFPPIWR